jgi:nucleoside-diphosphate-sugar epimerase
MTCYTILGSGGYVGSHLVKKLQERNIDYICPKRDEILTRQNYGHIIYCIGLTADFRTRPFDTIEAHVCKLKNILKDCEFESLVYLSSTRVYKNRHDFGNEDDPLVVNPNDCDDLYNISKLMGESLCNVSPKKTYILRLSNVYGNDVNSSNFLSGVIRDALNKKKINLTVSLDSEKDYVSIHDVTDLIISITEKGRHPVYNIASGRNISNLEIMNKIKELTSCEVIVAPDAKKIVFPKINITKIYEEFSFSPSFLIEDFQNVFNDFNAKNSH